MSRPRKGSGSRHADSVRMHALVQVLALGLAALAAACSAPTSLSAQEPEEGRFTLSGVVLDEVSGRAVPHAFVSLAHADRGIVADSQGVFRGLRANSGPQLFEVQALGYEDALIPMTITDFSEPLELHLSPDPVQLEGVEVMHDRFRSRRNSVAVASRAYEEEDLMRSAARDAMDFLARETPTSVVPCPGGGRTHYCVVARGRVVEPELYVDEMPITGGFDWLETYNPWELYLVEVYAGGRQIRIYTRQFMERASRQPRALVPIWVP